MKLKTTPEDFIVEEIPNFSLSPGPYLIYKLTKKLRNTEAVVQEISYKANIPRKNISYSGVKDNQAITTQYISIFQASKDKLSKFKSEGVTLEYVGTSKNHLNLGDHEGNKFEIIVRNCKKKPQHPDRVINYFGEQRFSKNNEKIGKALIKKDWKLAYKLIDSRLKEKNNDYLLVIKDIPLRIVTLYVRAYQAFLWNNVAEHFKDSNLEHIPLLGFATEFTDDAVEKYYEKLMKEEDITQRDFIIREYPHLTSEGDERLLYATITDLEIEEIDKKTYKLKFSLPKGSYATVAIEQLFQ